MSFLLEIKRDVVFEPKIPSNTLLKINQLYDIFEERSSCLIPHEVQVVKWYEIWGNNLDDSANLV